MDLTPINQAIEAAYATAAQNPQAVAPQEIAPGVFLSTDLYTAAEGLGFCVVCAIRLPQYNLTITRVRNSGPAAYREIGWPEAGIEETIKKHLQKCILQVESHVLKYFSPLGLLEANRKVTENTIAGTLANIPKTVAVVAWIDGLKASAAAGKPALIEPPYTFEEIVLE